MKTPAARREESTGAAANQRHIITCEFPPKPGGVSDYSYALAAELSARGEDVHVWSPEGESPLPSDKFTVHGELGRKSLGDVWRLNHGINQFPSPRRLLVQWVPHGYGYKSLNLPFCIWLFKRAKLNGDDIELMVHEGFIEFKGGWRERAAALVHRLMMILLLAASTKVLLSTSSWESRLKPYCLGRRIPFRWLPIPSNIPISRDWERIAEVRRRHEPATGSLMGHFGSYGASIGEMLFQLLPKLFELHDGHAVILMGKDSQQFLRSFLNRFPSLSGKIQAVGLLEPGELSCHIQACDLMIQPYPDGITTRRTSAMVSLQHGMAVATTYGHLTESVWRSEDAVMLESALDIQKLAMRICSLCDDFPERRRLGNAAKKLYQSKFDLGHTIAAIRASADG